MARIWVWGLRWFWYRKWRSCREGKAQGRLGIPAGDADDFAPFEYNVKNEIENITSAIREGWQVLDERLLKEYCEARREWRQAKKHYEELTRDATQVTGSRESTAAEARPGDLGPYLSRPAYAAIIAIVMLLELPVNFVVMQILGLDPLQTALATMAPAGILILCAHFVGEALRARDPEHAPLGWLGAVASAAVLLVLFGFAYIREEYVAQVVQRVIGVELNRVAIIVVFAALNIALLVLAMMAAYVQHNPEMEEFLKRQDEKRRRLAAIEGARLRKERAEVRLARARATRQTDYERYRAIGDAVKNQGQLLVGIYRHCNLTVRPDKRMPAFWKARMVPINTYFTEELQFICKEESEMGDGETVVVAAEAPVATASRSGDSAA